MNKILYSLDYQYVEDCMDDPLTLHMIESYDLKYHSWYPDTPKYMEALLGECREQHYKAIDEKNNSLKIRDAQQVVTRNYFSDTKIRRGICDLK